MSRSTHGGEQTQSFAVARTHTRVTLSYGSHTHLRVQRAHEGGVRDGLRGDGGGGAAPGGDGGDVRERACQGLGLGLGLGLGVGLGLGLGLGLGSTCQRR